MKILVVGASSFSGSHFCRFLRSQGMEVVEASLRNWTLPPRQEMPPLVVNFSAINVVAPSWTWPKKYLQHNVIQFTELLDYMVASYAQPPVKYVHISTPEVYGNVSGAIREDQPFSPSTPYAASRAAAEYMAACYFHRYNFPVVVTRSCNVYGPGQQLYRLIPKLIVSIRKGIKFPLEGGGASRRSFIHIEDLCRAIWRVLLDGTAPLAYNISTPNMYQIWEVVAFVAHMMDKDLAEVVEYAPTRPGQDAAYQLDTFRIRDLGWEPEVNLTDGVSQMIKWVDDNWESLKGQSTEYEMS